jgi:hypothetical protein
MFGNSTQIASDINTPFAGAEKGKSIFRASRSIEITTRRIYGFRILNPDRSCLMHSAASRNYDNLDGRPFRIIQHVLFPAPTISWKGIGLAFHLEREMRPNLRFRTVAHGPASLQQIEAMRKSGEIIVRQTTARVCFDRCIRLLIAPEI